MEFGLEQSKLRSTGFDRSPSPLPRFQPGLADKPSGIHSFFHGKMNENCPLIDFYR